MSLCPIASGTTPPYQAPPPPPPTDEEPENGDHLLASFLELSFHFLMSPSDSSIQDAYKKLYEQLRKADPKSLVPIHLRFAMFHSALEEPELSKMLMEAKSIDYHLAYVSFLSIVMRDIDSKKHKKGLQALSEAYPDDLVLPQILSSPNAGKKDAPFELSQIGETISKALHDLRHKTTRQSALAVVLKETQKLVGYSILQRYLVLALLLNGKLASAKTALSRADKFLDLANPFFSSYVAPFCPKRAQEGIPLPIEAIEPPPTPLSVFIELKESKAIDLSLALKFIETSTKALQSDTEQLPFVYFGMSHLLRHFKSTPDWSKLFQPLVDLCCLTAEICHQGTVDSWVESKFTRINYGDEIEYEIDFSDHDSEQAQNTIPKFAFTPQLQLTDDSRASLATGITKKGYCLLKNLMLSECLLHGTKAELPISPEIDPDRVKEDLHSHMMMDDGRLAFYLSVNQLKHLYTKKELQLDASLLNWVKFCIFCADAPSYKKDCSLDQEIWARYYPQNLTKAGLNNFMTWHRLNCESQNDPLAMRLAARDTIMASQHLSQRIPTVGDDRSPYGLYMTSKHLFGWRLSETFDTWGERLKRFSFDSPGLFGERKKEEFGLLYFFHHFWMQFHKHAKNNSQITPLVEDKLENGKPPSIFRNKGNLHTSHYMQLVAGNLISTAESQEERSYKIVISNETTANLLFPILLEVSMDRLVRKAIATLGPEPVDAKAARNVLNFYLAPLIGNFSMPDPLNLNRLQFYEATCITTEGAPVKVRVRFDIRPDAK